MRSWNVQFHMISLCRWQYWKRLDSTAQIVPPPTLTGYKVTRSMITSTDWTQRDRCSHIVIVHEDPSDSSSDPHFLHELWSLTAAFSSVGRVHVQRLRPQVQLSSWGPLLRVTPLILFPVWSSAELSIKPYRVGSVWNQSAHETHRSNQVQPGSCWGWSLCLFPLPKPHLWTCSVRMGGVASWPHSVWPGRPVCKTPAPDWDAV